MGVTKLRGEVEGLEPSQSVAFTELPGAPAVPQESPGPRKAGVPRCRQMAMIFGAQPMPQAPTAPIIPPGKSSVGIAVGAEEIPQIRASDILPQAPTPPTPARFTLVPPSVPPSVSPPFV